MTDFKTAPASNPLTHILPSIDFSVYEVSKQLYFQIS